MRILHFGKYWHKDGGIETHVKTLCKGLASNGIEVVNLVSSTTLKSNYFKVDGFTIVESPSIGVYFSTSISPRMVFDARRLNSEKSFDLIHLHFPDPMSHLASASLPMEIPRIITWHSDIIKQRRLLKLYRPFQLHAVQHSKAIVSATELHFLNSTQIPQRYPSKQRYVIPFGTDLDWLEYNSSVHESVRAIKHQAQGRFILFTLGRHVEYKGFSFLIDAIKDTQAFLFLGGDGPLTPKLKSQVQSLGLTGRIFFTGRLTSAEVAAHYHACDAFCLPSISHNEAFGIVQIEAMACGKPVICSNLDNGINEVTLNQVTGLTVPPMNAKALSLAIERLRLDISLRHKLGEQGLKRIKENYSEGKMIEEHLNLYKNVLSNND